MPKFGAQLVSIVISSGGIKVIKLIITLFPSHNISHIIKKLERKLII